MDRLDIIKALDDAYRLIAEKQKDLARGSTALWIITAHAAKHIDNQIQELMNP